MVKTAFSCWEGRIAPVFDVARHITLVEIEAGRVVAETMVDVNGALPVPKALRLAEMGVSHLVCGAISRSLQEVVASTGVEVHPFVSGGLREVIDAWLVGAAELQRFAMPGCRRRRSRQGRQRCGMGRRDAGGALAGDVGWCVCPQCAQRQPHERGVPCFEQRCPRCGIPMMRA